MNAERPRFGFVVEYVRDIETAKRFYVDVLGLKVEREHPTFVQFETFAIATDEPMGGEATQEVYWLVNDAGRAFTALAEKAEICLPLKQVPFGTVVRRERSRRISTLHPRAVPDPTESTR